MIGKMDVLFMVDRNMEADNNLQFESEIYSKLKCSCLIKK